MDKLDLKNWYICRDNSGSLTAYDKKPIKDDVGGYYEPRKNSIEINLPEECFPDIKFETGSVKINIFIEKVQDNNECKK